MRNRRKSTGPNQAKALDANHGASHAAAGSGIAGRLVTVVALASLAAALAAGCGSSKHASSSASAPSRGFESTGAYSFVHAHLRVSTTAVKYGAAVVMEADCFALPAGPFPRYVKWAEVGVRDGYCLGHYEAGSSNPSLNGKGGLNQWHYDERGLHITRGVNLGTSHAELKASRPWVECDVADRSKAECYTNDSQRGKPKTTEGGPFELNAHVPGDYESNFILLRGWCAMSDTKCNSVGPLGSRR